LPGQRKVGYQEAGREKEVKKKRTQKREDFLQAGGTLSRIPKERRSFS